VDVAGAAQRLAVLAARGDLLAEVVHQHQSELIATLDLAEVAEQRGDLAGVVLVAAVQPDEGVEDQEPWAMRFDGLAQPREVALLVEPQRRRVDEPELEVGELQPARRSDGGDPLAEVRQRIFGAVEEHRAAVGDREAAERVGATRDADGEVEREPGLVRLRRGRDPAHALRAPQGLDQPAAPLLLGGYGGDRADLERLDVTSVHAAVPSSSLRLLDGGSSRPRW
jgi:hypothetical protein